MKSRHPALVVVTSACAVLLLSSCGGGGGATYGSSAFAACLSREGASTFGTRDWPTKQKAALVRIVGSRDFVGAKFAGGEEAVFVFATDASEAKKIQDKVRTFASSPPATAGLVKLDGNMVLLLPLHSTVGVQKIISSCKADARLT